jgi:putative component of membrane protein insertase Oxa1/YidC/SpoIIIJ protein YidD
MTPLILFVIRVYWFLIPKKNRKTCVFKESCSNFVFRATKNDGSIKGLRAFLFRYKNCNSGIQVFVNPISNQLNVRLPSGEILSQQELAPHFVEKHLTILT